MKYQNITVLFSYLTVPLPPQFLDVLTRLGVDCPRHFLLNIRPPLSLHLHIRIPLPLPRHLCPPHATLSIYLPLTIPHHLCPTHAPLSLPLDISHHLHPPRSLLSLYITLHLPHPSFLPQRLPCCHSYPNTIQIIQCI